MKLGYTHDMQIEKISDTYHHITFADGDEVFLIGTAHVSQHSVEEVAETIDRENPDRICVELDATRLSSKTKKQTWENTDIRKVFKEGKGFLLLANTALASFQRKLGAQTGTAPGEELLGAVKLAEEFSGDAVAFDRFASKLSEVDIIISSTGSPDFVVTAEMIRDAMKKRPSRPMFFIDIAVPRDIDPNGAEIENTYIYDIDDLKSVVEANKKEREKEAKKAWDIIHNAAYAFDEQMESLKITPVIKNMRSYFEEKRNEELQKYCEKFKITDEKEIEHLNYLLTATLNKILHKPFMNLKEHATDNGKYSITEVMDIIFKK